nr:hypothetical protein [uncultured Fluviicola sp.]
MKRSLLCFLLILTGALTSCKKEKDYLYVIKSPVIYSEDSLEFSAPVFYGQNNFILYDSKTILYHNKSVFYGCGTGIDFTKPARLYLSPDSFTEIKYSKLAHFLKTKFNWKKGFHSKIMSIASSTDTIRNPGYTALMNFMKRHKEILCSVRKWTEEEEYTAKAKIKKGKYEPHKIKWKTGFADGNKLFTLEYPVRFLEPIEQKKEEIGNLIKPSKKTNLTKYFYPNMSSCGGALYGYYDRHTLVKIDSRYNAELGYSQKIIQYENEEITQIIYAEHFAKWDEYLEKYPNDEETDEKKMSYTDDRLEIDFYPVKKIRTYSNNQLTKNVVSEESIQQLLDCAKQMEKELSSEKQLVKVE